MSEKAGNLKDEYKAEDLELMASSDDWDMVTWFDQGVPVRHEFFFTYMGEESIVDRLKELVPKINHSQLLGKGYEIEVIEEPHVLCKVKVKPGWHVSSSLQCNATLKKFISFL